MAADAVALIGLKLTDRLSPYRVQSIVTERHGITMATLYELAKIVRSKNAGPFSITLDVLFDDEHLYKTIKASGFISKERVAQLYGIPVSSITDFVYYDPALGIKITFDRTISSGTAGDRDVYGAQQHAPLIALEIPEQVYK